MVTSSGGSVYRLILVSIWLFQKLEYKGIIIVLFAELNCNNVFCENIENNHPSLQMAELEQVLHQWLLLRSVQTI